MSVDFSAECAETEHLPGESAGVDDTYGTGERRQGTRWSNVTVSLRKFVCQGDVVDIQSHYCGRWQVLCLFCSGFSCGSLETLCQPWVWAANWSWLISTPGQGTRSTIQQDSLVLSWGYAIPERQLWFSDPESWFAQVPGAKRTPSWLPKNLPELFRKLVFL